MDMDRYQGLNTLSTIDDHFSTVDKAALVTTKVQTDVGNVICLGQTTQGNIPNELLAVLGGILHAGKHGKETGTGQQGSDAVDSNVVRAILGCKAFSSL